MKLKIFKILNAIFCCVNLCLCAGVNKHIPALLMVFIISETWYALYHKVSFAKTETPKISFFKKFGAFLLDVIIVNVISLVVHWGALNMCGVGIDIYDFENIGVIELFEIYIIILQGPIAILAYFLYFGLFEKSKLQATPGKLLFRLKVQGNNGERITASQSFYRQLGKLNEVCGIGIIVYFFINMLLTKKLNGKCFHDMMGNSVVVKR